MIATILVSAHNNKLKEMCDVFLKESGILLSHQLNFFQLDVETARTIIATAQKGFMEPTALILWNFHSASEAVQNTFLKTIEEVPANTILIFPVLTLHSLLPTIISRCRIIYTSSTIASQMPWGDYIPRFSKTPASLVLSKNKINKQDALYYFSDYCWYARDALVNGEPQQARFIKNVLQCYALVNNNNVDPSLALDIAFLQ